MAPWERKLYDNVDWDKVPDDIYRRYRRGFIYLARVIDLCPDCIKDRDAVEELVQDMGAEIALGSGCF